MKLEYILTSEELKEYYRLMLENDDAVVNFRWKLRLIVPAGTIVFLVFLGRSWLWPVASLLFAVMWFMVVDHIIYPQYETRVVNGYMKTWRGTEKITVDAHSDRIRVNGRESRIMNLGVFGNMMVAVLENGSNLIVPDRVFPTEEEKNNFAEMLRRQKTACAENDLMQD